MRRPRTGQVTYWSGRPGPAARIWDVCKKPSARDLPASCIDAVHGRKAAVGHGAKRSVRRIDRRVVRLPGRGPGRAVAAGTPIPAPVPRDKGRPVPRAGDAVVQKARRPPGGAFVPRAVEREQPRRASRRARASPPIGAGPWGASRRGRSGCSPVPTPCPSSRIVRVGAGDAPPRGCGIRRIGVHCAVLKTCLPEIDVIWWLLIGSRRWPGGHMVPAWQPPRAPRGHSRPPSSSG